MGFKKSFIEKVTTSLAGFMLQATVLLKNKDNGYLIFGFPKSPLVLGEAFLFIKFINLCPTV
jgi:hypothetical protein